MNRRAPENGILVVALAVALSPAVWAAQGFGWPAPWVVTFALHFMSSLLGVLGVWFMVGRASRIPSLTEIGLGVAGTTLMLGLLELGLRGWTSGDSLSSPEPALPKRVADAQIGWRLEPNAGAGMMPPALYRTDEHGFRTTTSTPAPTMGPPSPALALLGSDSSFGVGVPYRDTFLAHIGRRVAHDVRNYAVPGASVLSLPAVIEAEVLPHRPRLVIIGFAEPSPDALRPPLTAPGTAKPPDPAEVFRWLDAHSALWRAMFGADRTIGRYFAWGETTRAQRRAFTALVERARDAGAAVLFVRLPGPEPVAHPFLRRLFHRLGAPYVDLAVRADRPGSLLGPDGHLSARGHAWAAERIEPAVLRAVSP